MDTDKIFVDMQKGEAEFSVKAKDGSVEIIINGDDILLLTALVSALENKEVRELLQDAFQIAEKPITSAPSVQDKKHLS